MTTTNYNIQNEGAFTSRPLFLSDDSDFSSRDDEEYVANMDFMAIESDNEVLFSDDESDLSYYELHDTFESLYDEFKKLYHKYSSLKKKSCMFTC
jgi:hypothetical protein